MGMYFIMPNKEFITLANIISWVHNVHTITHKNRNTSDDKVKLIICTLCYKFAKRDNNFLLHYLEHHVKIMLVCRRCHSWAITLTEQHSRQATASISCHTSHCNQGSTSVMYHTTVNWSTTTFTTRMHSCIHQRYLLWPFPAKGYQAHPHGHWQYCQHLHPRALQDTQKDWRNPIHRHEEGIPQRLQKGEEGQAWPGWGIN